MKLIIIFGPHAVGKMTVGQSLSKLINIPLFHNHESIELALSLLGEENKWKELSNEIREVVFKHVSQAKGRGIIFTFMWAIDSKDETKKKINKEKNHRRKTLNRVLTGSLR